MRAFLISLSIFTVALPFATSAMVQSRTIVVQAGGDVQAALDIANCGDTIVLSDGAVFRVTQLERPFLAKPKPCSGLITIRAQTVTTLAPKDFTPTLNMPKLVTTTSTPALEFQAGTKDWLIQGIEITNESQGGQQLNNGLVFVGENSGSQPGISIQNVPTNITFDHCWVHSEGADTTTSPYSTSIRGFSVSARNLTIKQSRITGFRAFWKEGQTNPLSSNAVLINRGPGPYTITDNYLEAWFGTVFTGGGPQWVINQATVTPGATTTQATLTNITGRMPNVGELIAFQAPNMIFAVGVFHGQPYPWGAATVTSVSGNTVNYTPRKSGNVQSAWGEGAGGTPLTASPNGLAVWGGDVPRDVLVERNQFVKEPISLNAALQIGYSSKGHIELKVGERVTIQGNTFEGYHLAFVFTPRNQPTIYEGGGRDVWATLKDVLFKNNWVKRAAGPGHVFGIQLEDETSTSTPGSNTQIENCLFESGTRLVNMFTAPDVTFKRITSLAHNPDEDSMVWGAGGPSPNLKIIDSILYTNEYFFAGFVSGGASATWPNMSITGNVFIDTRKNKDNFVPAGQLTTLAGIGFDSQNRPLNYPGKGCNVDQMMAAIGGASLPTPTPTPLPSPSPTPTPTPVPSPSPSPSPQPSPTPSNKLEYEWKRFEFMMSQSQRDALMATLGAQGYGNCMPADKNWSAIYCARVKQ